MSNEPNRKTLINKERRYYDSNGKYLGTNMVRQCFVTDKKRELVMEVASEIDTIPKVYQFVISVEFLKDILADLDETP